MRRVIVLSLAVATALPAVLFVAPPRPAYAQPADQSTPRAAIAYQLALLRAGDVEALRACFTPRLRERITAERIARGRQQVDSAHMTVDELVGAAAPAGAGVRVTMRNGRFLTTLVREGNRWLADTIWF